jgi:multidrug efflux pump subunit AcrA (membrane-fusion protein)
VPVLGKIVVALTAAVTAVTVTWLQVRLAQRALPRVWVESTVARDVARTLTAGGTLRPLRRWTVSAPASGRVLAIDARVGDRVRAGQRLLVLESAAVRARRATSLAAFGAARSEVARLNAVSDAAEAVAADAARRALRAERLFERGLQAADDRATAQYQRVFTGLEATTAAERAIEAGARAQAEESSLDVALSAADRMLVRSPADGIVAEVLARVGQWVHEGGVHVPPSPLLTIESGELLAEVVLDQAEARWMDGVAALRSGPGRQATALVPLERVPPWARSGMSCTVHAVLGLRRSVLAVPNHALVELKSGARVRPRQHAVWMIQNGSIALKPISLGLRGDAYTEVLAGLAASQAIVTGPYAVLRSVRVGDAVVGIPTPPFTETPGAAARSSAGWGRCSSGPRR